MPDKSNASLFVVRYWRDGVPHWSYPVPRQVALDLVNAYKSQGHTWMQPAEWERL